VSKDKIKFISNFSKIVKSPRFDGWTVEFYSRYFDLVGEDLSRLVEDQEALGRF